MSHQDIPILKYGDFSRRVHGSAAGRRIPTDGSFEITARCNLRCVHCFIRDSNDDSAGREPELSLSEIRRILDEAVEEGCLWMLLTGGEPLSRPDFPDIYSYAHDRGLLITLFTNGTLITPEIAAVLAERRPFSIEVTLYGAGPETCERVTGVANSHEACLRGIRYIKERGLSLKLKTMVMTLNRREIRDMERLADDLAVPFRFDPILNLRIDGGKAPAAFRLSPRDVVELDLTDGRRRAEWNEFCKKFPGPCPDPDKLYQCGAGIGAFHIDARGRLSPCLMIRSESYDLRRGHFREGWREFLGEVVSRRRTKNSPCRTCGLISLCGQCPGWAEMETGDPELPVDYLCRIAHERADALGLNATLKG